mmetsp:Transcript_21764/g.61784  ORF Transcript_21764/g.61784 Transcript_21764/m.61784 type:complete len:513 (+) Transcript_21764:51-1589(+)
MTWRLPAAGPGLRPCLRLALFCPAVTHAVATTSATESMVPVELRNRGSNIVRRSPGAASVIEDSDGDTTARAARTRRGPPQALAPEEAGAPDAQSGRRPGNDTVPTIPDVLPFRVVRAANSTFAGERPAAPPLAKPPLLGTPATQGLRCFNCLLAVGASALIYRSRVRPASAVAGSASRGILGIENGFQIAIFFTYVAFSCTHMFLQRRAGTTGYSVVSATIVVYSLKCLAALLMYLCRGGRDFSALLEPAGGARFGRVPTCVLTLIPGGCLGGYDALSFLSLAALDPVTYQITMHLRLVFIALLWQFTFHRQLSSTQWFALLLFTMASTTKGLEQMREIGWAVHAGLRIVLLQILMAAGGNVMAECLLKEVPVPTDLLNTCLYFQGLVVLLVVVCVTQGGPAAVHSTLLAPRAWKELISDPWMTSSILCMTMFGIVTAYFLRELSSLLKELSACFVIVASAVVEWCLLGSSPCTMLGMQAVVLAILAVGVYNAEPLDTKKGVDSSKSLRKT